MKPYSIQYIRVEGVRDDVPHGAWLVSSDVDAEDGRGAAEWTTDPTFARRFANVLDAMLYYRRQSKVRPIRSTDGKPNRPLTAFTVQICLNPVREQ